MRKRRAFHVQTLLLFFQVSDDKCEIKFFNRLIRLEKNRFLEKLFRRNGYFFFFFRRGNTIASNGSRIDRIANFAHRVNISYIEWIDER